MKVAMKQLVFVFVYLSLMLHSDLVSAQVPRDFSVRLVRLRNSQSSVTNPSEGRLEIYYRGTWGTVCDDEFSNISARVACASLGFRYGGTVIGNLYGAGVDPIWLDDVICEGTEQSIERCRHRGLGTHNCGHSEDVSIRCVNVRLVNAQSSTALEGRLEIYYNGAWGTVCHDDFTHINARVACFSLGFGYIGGYIGDRHGAGTGPIWLDDVICSGNEPRIEECRHSSWGANDCDHREDVSISCVSTFTEPPTTEEVSTIPEALTTSTMNELDHTIADENMIQVSTTPEALTIGRTTEPDGTTAADENMIHESTTRRTSTVAKTSIPAPTITTTMLTSGTTKPVDTFPMATGATAPNVAGDKKILIFSGLNLAILLGMIIFVCVFSFRLNRVQSAILSTMNRLLLARPEAVSPVKSHTYTNQVYELNSIADPEVPCDTSTSEIPQKLLDF